MYFAGAAGFAARALDDAPDLIIDRFISNFSPQTRFAVIVIILRQTANLHGQFLPHHPK